ncbi:hypothetical protein DRQ17_07610 [bacterium]|nr:MAG: hypothetical protein DRQ17_07610 [bacterium]RKZ24431.1 MAG: hypothetical protein DRQ23_00190 [bacterium]
MSKKRRKRKSKVIKKILTESTPLLLLTVLGSAFAGGILGRMEEVIMLIPGVIILVPAILDLRGDVGASFGSRISSLLHLGSLEPTFRPSALLLNNISGAFSLSFVFSGFFGMFAHLLSVLLKLSSAGMWKLSMIGLFSGVLSSSIMIPFTLSLAILSFRRGLDPDDIISPAIAVVGDGIAISSIWVATILLRRFTMPDNVLLPVGFIAVGLAIPNRYRWWSIFIESTPVLITCGVLGIIAGLFLHNQESALAGLPYLFVLIPQIISKVGSMASIAGMRLTSALYLGFSKPFKWNRYVWDNIIAVFWMGVILVVPVAGISFITAKLLSIGKPEIYPLFMLTLLIMVPLSVLMSIFSFILASSVKRIGRDPSNFVVPLITSLSDIAGIAVFVLLLPLIF